MPAQTAWIPDYKFEPRDRERVLVMLDGSDNVVRQIEDAVALYFVSAGFETADPKRERQHARLIVEALERIATVANGPGIAWSLFRSNVAMKIGGSLGRETNAVLRELEETKLFTPDVKTLTPNPCTLSQFLMMAAEQTEQDIKASSVGRPKSKDKSKRIVLVQRIAHAVDPLGILPNRGAGRFPELVECVYEIAEIPTDYADDDIRAYLQR